jgi:hypothetical protein
VKQVVTMPRNGRSPSREIRSWALSALYVVDYREKGWRRECLCGTLRGNRGIGDGSETTGPRCSK